MRVHVGTAFARHAASYHPCTSMAECTFIVLDKARYLESGDLVGPMVGDVNLFFNDYHDKGCAEAEIMIAGV